MKNIVAAIAVLTMLLNSCKKDGNTTFYNGILLEEIFNNEMQIKLSYNEHNQLKRAERWYMNNVTKKLEVFDIVQYNYNGNSCTGFDKYVFDRASNSEKRKGSTVFNYDEKGRMVKSVYTTPESLAVTTWNWRYTEDGRPTGFDSEELHYADDKYINGNNQGAATPSHTGTLDYKIIYDNQKNFFAGKPYIMQLFYAFNVEISLMADMFSENYRQSSHYDLITPGKPTDHYSNQRSVIERKYSYTWSEKGEPLSVLTERTSSYYYDDVRDTYFEESYLVNFRYK